LLFTPRRKITDIYEYKFPWTLLSTNARTTATRSYKSTVLTRNLVYPSDRLVLSAIDKSNLSTFGRYGWQEEPLGEVVQVSPEQQGANWLVPHC
jgi:hypothetical protein